ncbi:MAG: exopolysaccharide biosynthesis polyprenyl glycosylphosphotransferase [Lachnospiraceae bacterium]|nr:exopolysaccharide biosynthesis polyprenyl glycosylphosphotransferase [Lachnospiraceae bacterium]
MFRNVSSRRIIILFLNIIGLLLGTGVYAFFWMREFYPTVSRFTRTIKYTMNGHILTILLYFVLLYFFTSTYGGFRVGYLKAVDVMISQFLSVLFVNLLTYVQHSLIYSWLMQSGPYWIMLAIQTVIIILWTLLSDAVYHKIYPPRELLLVHGERPFDEIAEKFESRRDKFIIRDRIGMEGGPEAVCEKIRKGNFRNVILWDIPTADRNRIFKYCYGESIRVYLMPKIPDVLIKGSETLHLFDTPLLLTREHALTIEQRLAKRLLDIALSSLLIVITSPLMLLTALAVKLTSRGPVLYKQVRCTAGGKEFRILKFRSMRIDAEKDGVARLASKHDDRITAVGKVIRPVRIDELPQLFNIFIGDMSFIGPRPERPEIIREYLKDMPEFAFRMKMKAGLAGYAQIYGKYNTSPYDKLKLDLTYIENYSIWLDIKLVLLTLKILLKPESTEGVDKDQTTAARKRT